MGEATFIIKSWLSQHQLGWNPGRCLEKGLTVGVWCLPILQERLLKMGRAWVIHIPSSGKD